MAQKFGGRYSPTSTTPSVPEAQDGPPATRFRGRRAQRVRISARLMYAAPLPLLLAGIGEVIAGDAFGMLAEFGAFALLMLSAVLLNEGLRAEEAYRSRAIARPPAIPRKLFAVAATGVGVFLAAAFGGGTGLIGGVLFGAVAAAAQFLAYGADPMRRKGAAGATDFETDRVAKAIDAAEATVAEILALVRGVGDRHLEARVESMLTAVRDVFRTVEEDPRDLTRARKFLSVYLTGARDATAKFAQLYSKRASPEVRADYEALLSDLEASFRAHREELLRDDKVALDVEIEVLRERLQQEGV